MVILVMYDHFHGIKLHYFVLWSINFQQLIINVLNIVLSKPVPLYMVLPPHTIVRMSLPGKARDSTALHLISIAKKTINFGVESPHHKTS